MRDYLSEARALLASLTERHADGVEWEDDGGRVWLLHRRENNGEPREYVGEELLRWRNLQAYLANRAAERELDAQQQDDGISVRPAHHFVVDPGPPTVVIRDKESD